MTDIVGTLTQPIIALSFLLRGGIIGVVALLIKRLLSPDKKLTLVLSDILSTLCYTTAFVITSYLKVNGIIYVYTLLVYSIGFTISYFTTRKIYNLITSKIKRILANHKQKHTAN